MADWLDERSRNGGIDEVPLPSGVGHLWLCGKHLVGPDPEAVLARTGAATIVCLNEPAELRDRYPHYVAWLTINPGRAIWFPIPDLHAPGLASLRGLVDDLRPRLDAGEGLVVHCGAGIGRSGTVAAAVLMTMGLPRPAALALLTLSRPNAGPETGAQTDVLLALEEALA